jgi:hypothetical protein
MDTCLPDISLDYNGCEFWIFLQVAAKKASHRACAGKFWFEVYGQGFELTFVHKTGVRVPASFFLANVSGSVLRWHCE